MKRHFKLFFLLLVCLPSFLPVQGQERSGDLNLKLKGKTLQETLRILERRTGYSFAYNARSVNIGQRKINLEVKNKSIRSVMDDITAQTGLSYTIRTDRTIVLEQKTNRAPATHSNAQVGKGSARIRGRVVESETSEPLPGATVTVAGTEHSVITDSAGYYRFNHLAEGRYTLDVEYLGFKTEQVPVRLTDGHTAIADIQLTGDNNVLHEVVISGIQRIKGSVPHTTDKMLVQEIKASSLVVSGISSEQIGKTADRNAAQVVQRISGITVRDDKFVIVRGLNPRYNLTYLNDNLAPSTETDSRAFALDLIPSRIIDKILVYKSPSPENQADATGGVVKIYTKDAKAVKHFDMEFQLGYRPGTTFNSDFLAYKGGKSDWLGFDDGTRALPKEVPAYGSLVRALLKPSQYAKAFNPTLSYGKKTALPNMQLTLNYYDAWRLFGKMLSSLTSFSYKNENLKADMWRQQGIGYYSSSSNDKMGWEYRNGNTVQSNLMQNFSYTLGDNGRISFKNFFLEQGADNTNLRNSEPTYNLISKGGPDYSKNLDIILSYNQRFLYAGNLGGTHYFDRGKHELQWNGGYTFSRQETPDQRVTRMTGIYPGIGIGDASLQWRAKGYDKVSSDADTSVPRAQGIISRLWMRNTEGVWNGSLDYTFKTSSALALKAGTFHQWKQRSMDRRIYTVHEANLPDPDVDHMDYNQYVNPELVRFRLQNLPGVWSEKYLNDNYTGLQVYDRTSGSDTYRGTEQNNSAYIMLDFTPRNRFIEFRGGLRYEYNRQKIAAAIPAGTYRMDVPILIDHPMKTWLPSVNVSFRPNGRFVIRASYGKTVNRTEFREVSPFREYDYANNQEIYGNPALVSATVDNYDFRFEFYPVSNKGDAFSIGLFRKDILNPIERVNTSDRGGGMPFPMLTYRNASSAELKGLEIELRTSLDFIPLSFFRNLSAVGNASFIGSKVKFDQSANGDLFTGSRPLQGQSPYLLNAGLYYDNAALGCKTSLIFNLSGESIYAAGLIYVYNNYINGPEYRGSLIELPRSLLDFSYTQRIAKATQLKLTVQNILCQAVKIAEDYNFDYKYEKQHPPVAAGKNNDGSVRYDYGDNIYSRYNPGRYYTFSVSYSF